MVSPEEGYQSRLFALILKEQQCFRWQMAIREDVMGQEGQPQRCIHTCAGLSNHGRWILSKFSHVTSNANSVSCSIICWPLLILLLRHISKWYQSVGSPFGSCYSCAYRQRQRKIHLKSDLLPQSSSAAEACQSNPSSQQVYLLSQEISCWELQVSSENYKWYVRIADTDIQRTTSRQRISGQGMTQLMSSSAVS